MLACRMGPPPPVLGPGSWPVRLRRREEDATVARYPNAVGVVARSRLSLAKRLRRLGILLQQFCCPCWWWCCCCCCCCSGMSTKSLLLLHCLIFSHFCFWSFVWEAFRCAVRVSPGTLIDKIRSLSLSLSLFVYKIRTKMHKNFVELLRFFWKTWGYNLQRWEREREREILQRSCWIVDL